MRPTRVIYVENDPALLGILHRIASETRRMDGATGGPGLTLWMRIR